MEAEEAVESNRDVADERKAWLEARATVIGATDSPKILGFSKHGTALSVYNDKIDPDLSDRQMSLPAWLGLRLENAVGELYTAATGNRLRADNRLHKMPGHPFIGCHLDFRVWGKPRLLVECKTRAYMAGWGEEGTQKVPVEIWVQVQHEMMVTGAEQCDIAVLFGHHTFRVYQITRDQEFTDGLLRRLIEFREQNWMARVPPLPTGHDVDTAAVKEANPEHTDEIKAATPEQAEVVKRYRMARLNTKQATLAEAEAANRIRDIIGTAAGITGDFGTITWKRTSDRLEVHWDQVARSLEQVVSPMPRVEVANGKGAMTGEQLVLWLHDIYTEVKPGTRRLHTQFMEEEE